MPENFTTRNLNYNDTLSDKAWEKNRLRPEVRYKLLNAAKFFIDSLNVPGFRVLDVILTGSMANYNYTKFSDFDVHVVTDYNDLQCDDRAEEFYRAKKILWNTLHDIIVRGHEVEMYVEDVNQPAVSGGVYSLLDDKWLRVPSYNPPKINDRAVNLKVADMIHNIESVIRAADDPEDIRRVVDKLRRMRRAGLDAGGEFSVENLTFKIIRNLGYIDRLEREYNNQIDADLGL
jgi:predicted nucleotidyltransferase